MDKTIVLMGIIMILSSVSAQVTENPRTGEVMDVVTTPGGNWIERCMVITDLGGVMPCRNCNAYISIWEQNREESGGLEYYVMNKPLNVFSESDGAFMTDFPSSFWPIINHTYMATVYCENGSLNGSITHPVRIMTHGENLPGDVLPGEQPKGPTGEEGTDASGNWHDYSNDILDWLKNLGGYSSTDSNKLAKDINAESGGVLSGAVSVLDALSTISKSMISVIQSPIGTLVEWIGSGFGIIMGVLDYFFIFAFLCEIIYLVILLSSGGDILHMILKWIQAHIEAVRFAITALGSLGQFLSPIISGIGAALTTVTGGVWARLFGK